MATIDSIIGQQAFQEVKEMTAHLEKMQGLIEDPRLLRLECVRLVCNNSGSAGMGSIDYYVNSANELFQYIAQGEK